VIEDLRRSQQAPVGAECDPTGGGEAPDAPQEFTPPDIPERDPARGGDGDGAAVGAEREIRVRSFAQLSEAAPLGHVPHADGCGSQDRHGERPAVGSEHQP
jgi:hypothetical protein